MIPGEQLPPWMVLTLVIATTAVLLIADLVFLR